MILVDTSVFIAASLKDHPMHLSSFELLSRVKKEKSGRFVCSHTLAEVYATLTAYPVTPMISPVLGEKFIEENILSSFQIVDLQPVDYREAIQRVRARGLRSGAIYDALIYQAAKKSGAKKLYTWDLGDFKRLTDPEISILAP